MEFTPEETQRGKLTQKWAIESAVRIALLAGLMVWCFRILQPFIEPILWGGIIAAATYPLFTRLRDGPLKGRNTRAAVLFTLLALAVLLIPTYQLTGSLFVSAGNIAQQFHSGEIQVPPPPARVQDWPLVGERLYSVWQLASVNLEAAFTKAAPQLQGLGSWMLGMVAGAGFTVLKFLFAIVLCGVFLAHKDRVVPLLERLAQRLVGEQGAEFSQLAGATVRSVAQGVLGVAFIQSLLAGMGMIVMGIPAAGVWAFLVLVLAIVQLPAMLVLLPVIIYAFSAYSTGAAVLFAIWSVLVGLSDSVLKPVLMGRTAPVPMLVIFIGAIGGFMLSGIIGLFTGAVVFVVGYTLVLAWFHNGAIDSPAGDQPPPVQTPPRSS